MCLLDQHIRNPQTEMKTAIPPRTDPTIIPFRYAELCDEEEDEGGGVDVVLCIRSTRK